MAKLVAKAEGADRPPLEEGQVSAGQIEATYRKKGWRVLCDCG